MEQRLLLEQAATKALKWLKSILDLEHHSNEELARSLTDSPLKVPCPVSGAVLCLPPSSCWEPFLEVLQAAALRLEQPMLQQAWASAAAGPCPELPAAIKPPAKPALACLAALLDRPGPGHPLLPLLQDSPAGGLRER